MTARSDLIDSLVSYDWKDWVVTRRESLRVVHLFKTDSAIDATIRDLESSGGLFRLYTRITSPELLREAVAVIASRSSSSTTIARSRLVLTKAINPVLTRTSAWSGFAPETFFDICHDLGTASSSQSFSSATSPSVGVAPATATATATANPTTPFTGVGATGINPTELSIGLIDQAALAAGHTATQARYSNPIPGSLSSYIATLTPIQRLAQARTLVRQPISTLFPHAYRGSPPLRSRVIWAAGRAHNLEPALIAAFILAEQRDQSRNEDAKDYIGATSLMRANTSIGLGQVVVSTARRNDLFADILSLAVRTGLSHTGIATLLVSDEYNIFATARYIRLVAGAATRIPISTLPNTQSTFPGIDMHAYANHSSVWPTDNVQALASEYTTRAWDDRLSTGWAWFVEQAFQTFRRSGIAFP